MREMAGLFLADYVQRVEAALTALELPLDYAARYQLPIFSEAPALEHAGTDVFGRARLLEPAACRAWLSMRETAHGDGVALELVSAYRSFEYQVGLVRAKREAGQSTKAILRSSAAPGFSEHHTGRAIDVALPGGPVLEEAFESSSGFDWLQRHAESFGFYLSYPRDNHHGITYEPWHWCYRDGATT